MNEFDLHRGLRTLPRDREPGRDLWPAIAARIHEPRASTPHDPDCGSGVSRDTPSQADRGSRRSHRGWLALAASLLLAALLAPLLWNQAPVPPSTVAHTSAGSMRGLQPYADAMTLEYVAALDQLGGPVLPPALAPVVTELDSSATQIRAALRQDPGATYLLDQLRRTYDQRLRLTQLAVAGLPDRTG